jgi:hypothetical protein
VTLLKIIQFIAVLAAASILGNWYLTEYRKARTAGLPLYRAYFTVPGILIVFFIMALPFIVKYI